VWLCPSTYGTTLVLNEAYQLVAYTHTYCNCLCGCWFGWAGVCLCTFMHVLGSWIWILKISLLDKHTCYIRGVLRLVHWFLFRLRYIITPVNYMVICISLCRFGIWSSWLGFWFRFPSFLLKRVYLYLGSENWLHYQIINFNSIFCGCFAEYKVHAYNRNGLCALGFMDDHYPVRSAFSLLNVVIHLCLQS